MRTTTHKHSRRIRVSALTILLLAGAPVSAIAQSGREQPEGRRAAINVRETTNARVYHFMKSGALIGADVVNANDETIASVSDLIIDRGSGRVHHALLKSGDVLGLGGKTIAIPFERLAWDNADRRFVVSMTQEQVDRAVEFDPEDWPSLDHTSWTERVDRWWNGEAADNSDDVRRDGAADDAWTRAVREGRTTRIDGTIMSVRREMIGGEEQVVAVVTAKDGGERELLLGPSWFVMGSATAPMRGDSIEAEVASVASDGTRFDVVTSATIEGQRVTLRDAEGVGRWTLPADAASGDEPRSNGRLMLVSDLVGAKAVASSRKEAGEIQNVVIEYGSGRVAILGFDPNEAFLGLGDEIKCVPWSVANVAPDGTVRIDASDQELSNCRPMPDDVTVLQIQSNLEPVYAAFRVPVQKFGPRPGTSGREMRHDAGQGARDAEYFHGFASGKTVNFSGDVVSVSSRPGARGESPVRVLTISTDQGPRTVILAPEWYMSRQELALKQGDRVTVVAREAQINGETRFAAASIKTPERQFTFWKGDKPVWDGD